MAEKQMASEDFKENTKVIDDLMDLQEKYRKRFGDILSVGPWGLTSKAAIEEIKEALRTGKPCDKYPRNKDADL
jgi:hypothetical protein